MRSDGCPVEDIDGGGHRLRAESLRGAGLLELSAQCLKNREYTTLGADKKESPSGVHALNGCAEVVEVFLKVVRHELLGPIR